MSIARLASGLGLGLAAGFVGTLAITASQAIDMKLRKREASDTPAKAVEKVFGLEPVDEQAEQRLGTLAHYAYGTGWGVARAGLAGLGLRGAPANALHWAGIQGAAMTLLPALKVAPPVKEWGAQAIAIELLHHAVYAVAAGLTYDALSRRLVSELSAETPEPSGGRLALGTLLGGATAMAARRWRQARRPEPEPRVWAAFLDRLPEDWRERARELPRKAVRA